MTSRLCYPRGKINPERNVQKQKLKILSPTGSQWHGKKYYCPHLQSPAQGHMQIQSDLPDHMQCLSILDCRPNTKHHQHKTPKNLSEV